MCARGTVLRQELHKVHQSKNINNCSSYWPNYRVSAASHLSLPILVLSRHFARVFLFIGQYLERPPHNNVVVDNKVNQSAQSLLLHRLNHAHIVQCELHVMQNTEHQLTILLLASHGCSYTNCSHVFIPNRAYKPLNKDLSAEQFSRVAEINQCRGYMKQYKLLTPSLNKMHSVSCAYRRPFRKDF